LLCLGVKNPGTRKTDDDEEETINNPTTPKVNLFKIEIKSNASGG
jgi:hypothetical protein